MVPEDSALPSTSQVSGRRASTKEKPVQAMVKKSAGEDDDEDDDVSVRRYEHNERPPHFILSPTSSTPLKLPPPPRHAAVSDRQDRRDEESSSSEVKTKVDAFVDSLTQYAKTAPPSKDGSSGLGSSLGDLGDGLGVPSQNRNERPKIPTLADLKNRISGPLQSLDQDYDVFENEPEKKVDVINIVLTPESNPSVEIFPASDVQNLKDSLDTKSGGIDLDRVVQSIGSVVGGVHHVTDVEEFHTRISHTEGRQPQIVHEETKAVVKPRWPPLWGHDADGEPEVRAADKRARRLMASYGLIS